MLAYKCRVDNILCKHLRNDRHSGTIVLRHPGKRADQHGGVTVVSAMVELEGVEEVSEFGGPIMEQRIRSNSLGVTVCNEAFCAKTGYITAICKAAVAFVQNITGHYDCNAYGAILVDNKDGSFGCIVWYFGSEEV